MFHYTSFNGDAQARVANAYYVLFSRDPHLAAMGFVWNPLPSLVLLPLLPLKALWPALTTRAFAGNVESAVFMAGAAYQIEGLCRDLGLRRGIRWGLTAAFALNPMIIYYGANGMSEAIFLFMLTVATRYLARWLRDDRTGPLVVAASALGLAYLSREETVLSALFVGVLVLVVAFRRASGSRNRKAHAAILDASISLLPFSVCFIGWAALSLLIVGHPFEQFSSVYGNASQLRILIASLPKSAGAALMQALGKTILLAPLVPVVVILSVRRSNLRRDARVLAPLSVTGAVLAFAIGGPPLGKTYPWLRYYITAVPLLVMVAACLISCAPANAGVRMAPLPNRRSPFARVGFAVLLVAATATSLPGSAWAMSSRRVGYEESIHLGFVFNPGTRDPVEVNDKHRARDAISIARAIDSMKLPHGAILIDDFTECVPFIILVSTNPQQFIIPSDQDFARSNGGPDVWDIRYMMLPPPVGLGKIDALNRVHPQLYDNGGGLATQVREFDFPGCPKFRLYKVLGSTS